MSANPIKYTSRTFQTILNDINSDPILKDKPLWWKTIWAGIGDVFSLYQDIIINEAHLKTAQTKESVDLNASLINYQPTPLSTAYGHLYFNLKRTCSGEYSFLTSELIASNKSSLVVSSKKYSARADVTHTIQSSIFTSAYLTDIFTLSVPFEFYTGYVVRLTTTGTLPASLAIDTDYYIIKLTDSTFKLASSLKNAVNGVAIDISNDGSGNHTITSYTLRTVVYQQERLNSVVIGKSDGISKWQEFNIPVLKALKDTISIVINGEVWTRKESLIDSYENDKHFYVYYKEDNQAVICFGNNVYGKIPAEHDIYCSCYYGGGILSNVSIYNISQYIGSNSNIESVVNVEDFTNGEDAESIEDTRKLAPMNLKTNDKFISTSDGVSLVLKYGGVSQCKINRNQYGLLTTQVVIIPTGGGMSTSQFKTDLTNYLINLTILECIDIRVYDATYKSTNLTAGIKLLTGYNYIKISNYVKLAIRLLLSEIGYEIKQDFINNGIESAISKINTKWSTSFDSNDYIQINLLLTNLRPNEIGKSIQMSDIQGYVDTFVEGCDYIIISSPSFPIVPTVNEIISDGVITLTEIS